MSSKIDVCVPAEDVKAARTLIESGQIHEGLSHLLQANAKVGGAKKSDVTPAYDHSLKVLEDKYIALGLKQGCEPKDVKKAYRKLVLKYHPDKNPHTTPVFQAIQNAYEVLSEPGERKKYDRGYKPASNPRKWSSSGGSGGGGRSAPPQPQANQGRSSWQQNQQSHARNNYSNAGDGSGYKDKENYYQKQTKPNPNRWQQQQQQQGHQGHQSWAWRQHQQQERQRKQQHEEARARQERARRDQEHKEKARRERQYWQDPEKARNNSPPKPQARAPIAPSYLKVLDVQVVSCVLQWANSGHGNVYELQWRERKTHPAYAKVSRQGGGCRRTRVVYTQSG